MEKVVLGLGSNVGNRSSFIRSAIKEISLLKGIIVLAGSNVYETEPWGLKNQRDFLNSAVVCLCKLDPAVLFRCIKKIETKLGRKKTSKWSPREIDIDILFFGSHIIRNKSIVVPHPMIAQRKFVLCPLNELIPDFIHPVVKKKMSVLLGETKDAGRVSIYNWQVS